MASAVIHRQYRSDMTAEQPTILATSGGVVPSKRIMWEIGPLTEYAIELAGVEGRNPRVCFLGTACGDNPVLTTRFYEAAQLRGGIQASHLNVLPMPNVEDMREHLLGQDVIWVWGGSVAGLLALWRLHGVDAILREAWEQGILLCGSSAGAICWFEDGLTDSYGGYRRLGDGLGFLSGGFCPHWDGEPARQQRYHEELAAGMLDGYAVDDRCALHFEGTELVEAFGSAPGVGARWIGRNGERALEVRQL